MKKYRIGIIGYGGFGKFLHYWWEKLPNVEMVAISDSRYQGDHSEYYKVYTDWKLLVQAEDIDIVSIVTPPSYHAEMACAAMLAGKHVILEKPIATNNEDAQMVLDVARVTGKVLIVDHMLRYNPLNRAFASISKSNILGPLRHVEVSNYAQDNSLTPDHWFWNEKKSGGIMVEHGVHFFDIVNSLTDQKCITVSGINHKRNEGQRDQVTAITGYDQGLIASHYHAFSGPGFFESTTIRLIFDLARVEIEGWIPTHGKLTSLVNKESKTVIEDLPGWKQDNLSEINSLTDISRPEGWGDVEDEQIEKPTLVYGIEYDVNQMLTGTFALSNNKSEIYGACLQEIITDLIKKIEDETHQLTITPENAQECLRMAVAASKEQ